MLLQHDDVHTDVIIEDIVTTINSDVCLGVSNHQVLQNEFIIKVIRVVNHIFLAQYP